MKKLFTSESVTEGHPDKLCDTISDAVLDAVLSQDPQARVACEVCACTGFVLIMGETTTTAKIDFELIARKVIAKVGYTDNSSAFSADKVQIMVRMDKQSPDIAQGVNAAAESISGDSFDLVGAGDQGMMFGYATDETEEMMPLAIVLAHKLSARLTEVRKTGILKYLRPDGKAQVTVEYDGDKPIRVDTIVVSAQHSDEIEYNTLISDIKLEVIQAVIPSELMDINTKIYINPTGRFVIGGPESDSGLTGRKLIVDTYGGYCAHGGGSFSGKDATKVDRSATYMARYVCKNIVGAGLARRCEMEVAYAIGRAHPVSVMFNTYNTGIISDDKLVDLANEVFDLRPKAIIEKLRLHEPIFESTSNYGHFGRKGFTWEKLDAMEKLLEVAKKYTK